MAFPWLHGRWSALPWPLPGGLATWIALAKGVLVWRPEERLPVGLPSGLPSCTRCPPRTRSGSLLPLQSETQESTRTADASLTTAKCQAQMTCGLQLSWAGVGGSAAHCHCDSSSPEQGFFLLKLRSWPLRLHLLFVSCLLVPVFTDHRVRYCLHGFSSWIFFLFRSFPIGNDLPSHSHVLMTSESWSQTHPWATGPNIWLLGPATWMSYHTICDLFSLFSLSKMPLRLTHVVTYIRT